MSNRNAIIVGSATVILALLILTNFGRNLPFLGEGNRKDPNRRPDRADQELLERFAEKTLDQIINTLVQELPPVSAKTESFSDALPDLPLPYPEKTTPADPEALQAAVSKAGEKTESEPVPLDKWKANLSIDAGVGKVDSLPESWRLPEFPSQETENFPTALSLRKHSIQGPIAFADLDEEPGLEIISHGGSRLFKSGPDGKQTPVDSLDGVYPGSMILPADYDGDGDQDLFIVRSRGLPNSLLRNMGDLRFEDVTIEQGLLAFADTTCAAWLDFDNDGWLDLAVGNRDDLFELYHQKHDGTFEPLAWEIGIRILKGVHSMGAADLDGDARPEIFLGIEGAPDQLVRSFLAPDAPGWRFDDVSVEFGIAGSESGSSALFFDFDNDGDLDAVVGDPSSAVPGEAQAEYLLSGEVTTSRSLRLYQNDGEGNFTNITEATGLEEVPDVRSIVAADLDHDGFEDLVVGTGELSVNRAFWNRLGLDFREISVSSGLSYVDGVVGFAVGDVEENGKTDLLAVRSDNAVRWHETEEGVSKWIGLHLRGSRPGTKVALVVRDQDWVLQPVQRVAGTSPILSLGLGNAKTIESIEIFDPAGDEPVKTMESVKPNQSIVIQVPAAPRERSVVPMQKKG